MQLVGGMVLHAGGIAEMRTGEGKTLVATAPVYLNALAMARNVAHQHGAEFRHFTTAVFDMVPIHGDIRRELPKHEFLGEQISRQLHYYPAVTREDFVHRGRLRVTSQTADGRRRLLRVLGPGDVVGEVELLTGHPPRHLVSALGEASVCSFRRSDLADLLSHPSVAREVIRVLAERLERADETAAAASTSPVRSRVAGYLLDQPAAGPPGREAVRLPLARADIASLLGTTPESVSRQLRVLREAGVVEGGRRGRDLVILDRRRLRAWSG